MISTNLFLALKTIRDWLYNINMVEHVQMKPIEYIQIVYCGDNTIKRNLVLKETKVCLLYH